MDLNIACNKEATGKKAPSIHQKPIRAASMSHPFLVKEIALQAGVGEATVDRVLNGREGVRRHTAERVRQAIRELEGQSQQAGMTGRKFVIEVVMQAPERFFEAVRAALESEMPALQPAVFRARYHFREDSSSKETATLIDTIGRRGSHGLLLKAPDDLEMAAAVDRLSTPGKARRHRARGRATSAMASLTRRRARIRDSAGCTN